MLITCEKSLKGFEFWCGAKGTAKFLTEKDFDIIEGYLEELYPEGMDETEINDFFWFEDNTIAEWLGYESFDALMEDREH